MFSPSDGINIELHVHVHVHVHVYGYVKKQAGSIATPTRCLMTEILKYMYIVHVVYMYMYINVYTHIKCS